MCKDGGREWEGEGTVMDQDRHTCTCHLPAFLMQDPPFGYVVSQKIKQTQTIHSPDSSLSPNVDIYQNYEGEREFIFYLIGSE